MKQKRNIKVVESKELSSVYDPRYIIQDAETGEVLDNAQGYGYRSIKNAYAAWTYKTRDKSKDKEKEAKIQHIRKWLKEHKEFRNALDVIAWDIVKGSGEKFDTKLIKKVLKEQNLEPDFFAKDLLKVWQKY